MVQPKLPLREDDGGDAPIHIRTVPLRSFLSLHDVPPASGKHHRDYYLLRFLHVRHREALPLLHGILI